MSILVLKIKLFIYKNYLQTLTEIFRVLKFVPMSRNDQYSKKI